MNDLLDTEHVRVCVQDFGTLSSSVLMQLNNCQLTWESTFKTMLNFVHTLLNISYVFSTVFISPEL